MCAGRYIIFLLSCLLFEAVMLGGSCGLLQLPALKRVCGAEGGALAAKEDPLARPRDTSDSHACTESTETDRMTARCVFRVLRALKLRVFILR